MTEEKETLQIGDVTLVKQNGSVVVQNCGVYGTITAAGLIDAARLDDDSLSQLGALAYGAEKYMDNE